MNIDTINNSKYALLLKIINEIFKRNNIQEITDITNFINIDREIIIKEKDIMIQMENEIFKIYDKSKTAWYRRNIIKNYILTFFRYSVNEIGYQFTLKEKDISQTIDGKKYRRKHMLYSIIKK